jgi:shikimate kinase
MNIVLTGFMGTGKTTVGRRVADKLKLKFIDVDTHIEELEKLPIAEVFKRYKEPAFRKMESAAIDELSDKDGLVISAGGGAIMNAANRENLKRKGILVCLTAKTGTILERLKDDLARPLLAGENREETIDKLMKERQAVYDSCPVQVETDGKTIEQVAEEIIQKVSAKWQA